MTTEPVCVLYEGIHDGPLMVQLFGGKRWFEDGWVYRLEGEVVVDGDIPRIYYYDDILVYMVQGRVVGASDEVFVDTTGEHPYSWEEFEYLIASCEAYDEDAEDVDSITDEECLLVYDEEDDR